MAWWKATAIDAARKVEDLVSRAAGSDSSADRQKVRTAAIIQATNHCAAIASAAPGESSWWRWEGVRHGITWFDLGMFAMFVNSAIVGLTERAGKASNLTY